MPIVNNKTIAKKCPCKYNFECFLLKNKFMRINKGINMNKEKPKPAKLIILVLKLQILEPFSAITNGILQYSQPETLLNESCKESLAIELLKLLHPNTLPVE